MAAGQTTDVWNEQLLEIVFPSSSPGPATPLPARGWQHLPEAPCSTRETGGKSLSPGRRRPCEELPPQTS
ncbi:unnamed protein product [Lota lota]